MATRQHPAVELEDKVERILRDAKWRYQREVVLGSARPDFVVTTDTGDQIVLEVKDWDTTTDNAARAKNQAQRYHELSKAAAAIVVTRSGNIVPMQNGGVAPVSRFLPFLSRVATRLGSSRTSNKSQQVVSPSPKKKVFASMPFAARYDDTFLVAIEPAALAHGAVAERVDHNGAVGSVVPQIQAMIRAAKVVIADLSASRPNVLHEVGFAEALGKPVVQICSTPTSKLPFNVRNNQTITYTVGQTARLRKKLEAQLQSLI